MYKYSLQQMAVSPFSVNSEEYMKRIRNEYGYADNGMYETMGVVGGVVGAGVGAFMILTVSPIQALIFLVFVVVLQQLEGNLIYPKVVGSSIGLPGVWVLAAVTIGGGLMGIPGMLLGVPTVAALYQLIRNNLNKKE
mgnify:CR=1 FL=1